MRSLIRLLYPFGSVRRVLLGPARGLHFVVEPGIGFTYAVNICGPTFLVSKVHKGMTVYDIGANKGQTALILANCVGPQGRILAFEPSLEVFASLKKNIVLNGLEQVQMFPMAISSATGQEQFIFSAKQCTQGKLANVEPENIIEGQRIEVQTITLDDMVKDGAPPPDLIKIDVEGAAAAVLKGATNTLDSFGPPVFVELHGLEERTGIRDYLLPRGYKVETLSGEAILDPTTDLSGAMWCYKAK